MKKIFLFFCMIWLVLTTSQSFAYPEGKAIAPFKIIGNVYYVGTDDLASYLIVTSQGNILINSNLESQVPLIEASIEQLGFHLADTKLLLISHAHQDHAGGSRLIQQKTKAQYLVMDEDVPLVESGGKSDFQYGADASTYFAPAKVDKVLRDGEIVRLGDTLLQAHKTPGHTKGCTTWTLAVQDQGKTYQVTILGSLSVNPGYQLLDNPAYPRIAKDYEQAFTVLKNLPCDVFLGAHAGYFDLAKKYAALGQSAVNPFIDPEGYKKYIAAQEQAFYVALQGTWVKQWLAQYAQNTMAQLVAQHTVYQNFAYS